MSFYSTKSLRPEEENEGQTTGPEIAIGSPVMGLRRYSVASNDSRMSEFSAYSGRRFSTLATQVEKIRKISRSISTYKSPYSKPPPNLAPKVVAKIPEQFENTYQMEPKQKFPVEEVRQIIIKTLQNGVGDEVYSQLNPTQTCKTLSQLIKDQVKSLNIDRFRIVCVVTIGTKDGEGIRMASRCLWDATFDRFASASVENGTLFAVGTVYAVYFE